VYASIVGRWIRLDLTQPVFDAERHERLGLRRHPERRQAGGLGSSLDRCHVDVGGEVLPADEAIRVVADRVPDVRLQRAVATSDRVVQLGGLGAVVDEDQQPASKRRRDIADPCVETERDLRGLTVASSMPSSARRAASAGVVGSISISVSRPSAPTSTASSRRVPR
jgi:hypothetical protein